MSMNIYQRLNKVREAVAYLQKDKEVQGYKAITHDAVTAAVRPEFIKHGVMVVPSLVSAVTIQETRMATKSGVPIIRYEAEYDVRFVNIDNPEDFVTVHIGAHALDQGDKAPGKATSYATKYAMLKLLSIETGEDEEGRQPVESEEVATLRKLVNNEDAEGLFLLRYSMNIEQWNAVTGVARQSAEKKRDWDNMVKDLLQQHEETLDHALIRIKELIEADDGPGVMEEYDGLKVPEKKFVFKALKAHEQAFVRQWADDRKKAA